MRKKEVEISARMKALTKLVSPGLTVCDVGCDHGFVSIYLVQKKIAPSVLAMDVRSGPLSQAKEHIAEYGLKEKITTRLSDGLKELDYQEAECMICAGMGGPLMIKILEESREKALAMKELILQPQSEIEQFRKYLRTNGYHIIEEDMVFEDGKYYPMMKVVPKRSMKEAMLSEGNEAGTGSGEEGVTLQETEKKKRLEDVFGPVLLREKHPVLKQYLEHSEKVTRSLIEKLKEQNTERTLARVPELETEFVEIQNALELMADH